MSTVDEELEAEILPHVVDVSAVLYEDYFEVVDETLDGMGIADAKKIQLVFNKIDTLEPYRIVELKKQYPEAGFISAERGIGLLKLEEQIRNLIERDFVTETMSIPAAKYEGGAFLHRDANIRAKKYVR